MKKCIHPNVVRLIEVIDDPNARKIYLGKAAVVLDGMVYLDFCKKKKNRVLTYVNDFISAMKNSPRIHGGRRSALERPG